MAREHNLNGANYLIVGDVAGVDITGATFSCSIWLRPDAFGEFTTLISKGDGATGQYNNWCAGANPRFSQGNGGEVTVTHANNLTTGVWNHWGVSKIGTGTNQVALFLNNVITRGTIGFNLGVADHTQSLTIGNPSFPFDGYTAEAALWDVGLSDDEMAALAKGFSPLLVRPESLRSYWPILGAGAPEPNLVDSGANLTVTGSVPKADHPRIIMPREAIYLP